MVIHAPSSGVADSEARISRTDAFVTWVSSTAMKTPSTAAQQAIHVRAPTGALAWPGSTSAG